MARSRSVEGKIGLQGEISAGEDNEEHGQDFAIAEIVVDQAFGKGGEDYGDGAIEEEAAVAAAGRKLGQAAVEIEDGAGDEPHHDEHGGDAAFGGVLQIDVMEVAVPAIGQGTGGIR